LPCVQEVSKRQNFIEVMADGLQPVEGDVKIEVYHKEGLGKVRFLAVRRRRCRAYVHAKMGGAAPLWTMTLPAP